MSPRAVVEPVEAYVDVRGILTEPIAPHELGLQRNVHLAVTEPGAVRGNHYHERGVEIAVVLGPCRVRLREDGVLRDVMVPDGTAMRFTMPAGVSHAFENVGARPMVLVAFNTEERDPVAPDLVRDVLIEPRG